MKFQNDVFLYKYETDIRILHVSDQLCVMETDTMSTDREEKNLLRTRESSITLWYRQSKLRRI